VVAVTIRGDCKLTAQSIATIKKNTHEIGVRARSLRGDPSLFVLKVSALGGDRGERGRAMGLYDSPAPILVTCPSPLFSVLCRVSISNDPIDTYVLLVDDPSPL
jgi:hypothetical protein